MSKVLLVVFDGADKEIMEDMDLPNLKQSEFGFVDNSTGIFKRSTTELHASILTGSTYEDHGVKGLNYWNNSLIDKFENFSEDFRLLRKFKGIRSSFYRLLGFKKKNYYKGDFKADTILDRVQKSTSFGFPGVEPGLAGGQGKLREHGVEYAARQQEATDFYKRKKLLDLLGDDYDVVLSHFHKIDHFHHWFWEIGREEKAWEAYREADEYAGKLKEKALEEGFDYIIFMSDHGLPTESQHNKNAFYSCNKELFGDETPHITDFHDKILDLVGETEGEISSEKKDELTEEEEERVQDRLKDLGYI